MSSTMYKIDSGLERPINLRVKRGPGYIDINVAEGLIKEIQTGLDSVSPKFRGNLDLNGKTYISKRKALNKLKSDCSELLHLINHASVIELAGSKLISNSDRQSVRPLFSRSLGDDGFLERVISEVDKHLADPHFCVKALSECMGFSANYIYRRVKSLTGLTVKQLIRDYRLKVAAYYLTQKEIKVSEILYKVGFSCPSYFSACFKNVYNCTPSEYKLK